MAHIEAKEQESATVSVAEAGHFVGATNSHRPARHAVLGGPKGTHIRNTAPIVAGQIRRILRTRARYVSISLLVESKYAIPYLKGTNKMQ